MALIPSEWPPPNAGIVSERLQVGKKKQTANGTNQFTLFVLIDTQIHRNKMHRNQVLTCTQLALLGTGL